jgi:phosphoribosylformylglycinamidine synthase
MRAAVLVFPGSNCDRDVAVALRDVGAAVTMTWHAETELPARTDLVVVPGGFAHGDYLRCGAMAARSAIMPAVSAHAARGGLVLGLCNGFQILTEAGLLPGALLRNAGLAYVCRDVALVPANTDTPFTRTYVPGEPVRIPVGHHDGNYTADEATLDRLESEGRVAWRYAPDDNPNGSARDIAGVLSANGRVLGMMPHPERLADPAQGGIDGRRTFEGLMAAA